MKLVRYSIVAAVVLCLPVAMAEQTLIDFGDVGAAYAKNDKSANKGNSGKSGKSKSKSKSKTSSSKSGKSKNGSSKSKSSKSANLGGKDKSAKGPKAALNKLRSAFKPKSKSTASAPVKPSAAPLKTKSKTKVQTNRVASKTTKKTKVPATAASVMAATANSSDLKALNSLNRNVNGLYNGNDPKMEPFRQYIDDSLDSEKALANLEAAREAQEMSQEDFDKVVDDLGLVSDNPDDAEEEILARTKELLDNEPSPDDPDYDQKYADWVEDLVELDDAIRTVEQHSDATESFEQARMDAEDAQDAVSEEALREAIAESINATGQGPVTSEDISPEVETWVANKLGVGDAEGFIDQWPVESADETDDDADLVLEPSEDPVEPIDPELPEDEVVVTAVTE